MSKSRALVWVTDKGYLVPSLIAAIQASNEKAITDIAEIYIFVVGIEEVIINKLRNDFSNYDLNIVPLDQQLFIPNEGSTFHKTHIPITALGRFAIQYVLPSNIKNIVYLDGDIQILGSIFNLVNHTVKEGYICASPDFLWLCENDIGPFWEKHKKYLYDIGVPNVKEYFNSGIMAFTRNTWEEMAPKALSYFNEHSEKCIYHDQSALNAVFYGKREPMSPLYNFGTYYSDLEPEFLDLVKIAHFTGGKKPWKYIGKPWNDRFIQIYQNFISKYEYLRVFFNPEIMEGETLTEDKNIIILLRNIRKLKRSKSFKKYMKSKSFIFI